MTSQPTADTLYEVIDRETFVSVAYFNAGFRDQADAYAAVHGNAKVMIYLPPAKTFR